MRKSNFSLLKKHTVYIGLGSNLGDRQMFIAYGIRRLTRLDDSTIGGFSGLYATEPVGIVNGLPFLNMVVKLITSLDVYELLENLQQIERDAGRTNTQSKKSRVLDLDILFYDNDIIDENGLVVPHPEVHCRRFVLQPLSDIAADFIHPVKEKSIKELLEKCPQEYWIKRLSN